MKRFRILYADDDTSSVRRLIRLRAPSILLGLILGIILAFVFSRFEEVLSKDIRVAFFIPFVVYIAAAVGAQTQSIFARDLKSGHASFKKYLSKEISVGLILGLVSAVVSALIAFIWFQEAALASVVGIAMLLAVSIAPLVALLVTESLQIEHLDPAVGAGPIATVIQDTLSVLIYGLVASFILL
ncbi:magnesium transporter [Patescibacteria group bacterium]|jgi:magnesium transporter|nr:magnesium transporter [Patescibacteria group bacterium]